jgi:hypothetical protein
MRKNSAWLTGVALVTVTSACAGQELPHPTVLPGSPPAAGGPGAGETSRWVPSNCRPPYPPPLPAVADPRTGAWRQVYVPPGECVDLGPAVQVGVPCRRCGDKLLHPFHGRVRATLLGRHPQAGDGASGQPSGPEGVEALTAPAGIELLPPRVPVAGPSKGGRE